MPLHETVSKDTWIIAGFKEDEISFNPHKIVDEFDKLMLEIVEAEQNPAKTVLPHYMSITDNIALLTGITHDLKLGTGEETATFDYVSLGTDATAENESHTDLQAEDSGGSYARLQVSVAGQRKVVNQTAKYGVQWLDSNISATGTTYRETGLHWHLSDTDKCFARAVPTAFQFDSGDIYVTRINVVRANASL